MHLDRQYTVAIEIFQQQRKPLFQPARTDQLLPVLRQQCRECHPIVRTAVNDALVVAVIDDFPRFGVVRTVADRFAQRFAEPPAAPDGLFQNRSKTQRRQINLHGDSNETRWGEEPDATVATIISAVNGPQT